MRRRLFFVPLLSILLAITGVFAQVSVDLARGEHGESFVEYPVISGMDNSFAQDSANAALKASMQPLLDTLALIKSGAGGTLLAAATYEILTSDSRHDVLSVLIEHEGRLPTGRSGHGYVPLMLDMATGQPVTVDALFANMDDAHGFIDRLWSVTMEETLSNYLDADDFLPIPVDNAIAGRDGLTFFYPSGGPAWLSGNAAAVRFLWHELEPILNLSEGSLLSGLGIAGKLAISRETLFNSHADAVSGVLPGLPAQLGDSVEALIGDFQLLFDPEGFPGGTAYYPEDDRFRGTFLISTDGHTVSGILSTRLNLYGLITGKTTMAEARHALGQPSLTLPLDEAAAKAYTLPAGKMDTWQFGGNELRLHYDETGILRAVWLALGE